MVVKSKRSSTNVTKLTTRSTSLLKKDRSSVSTRERRSSVNETFSMQFQKFCNQFNSWTVPNISVVPHEPVPGDFPELPSKTFEEEIKVIEAAKDEPGATLTDHKPFVPVVLAIFDNYEIQTVLNAVLFKHFRVDRSMLIALRKTLQNYDTVGTLKLEYCQLKNTDLRTLKTILERNVLITDLSINGNPNRFQNFYILLKDTKLQQVSMRFCQINDRGIHLIALQLDTPFDQSVISLDLSSNFISDQGTNSIANALRINRTLLSLNLADNWLTDAGCIALMDVLQTFPLKHEEIVIRRHRIMDFLQKKEEAIQLHKLKFLQKSTESLRQRTPSSNSSQKKSTRSLKTGKDSTRKSSKGRSPSGSMHKKDSTTKRQSTDIDMALVLQAVESEMKADNHPFVKNCYPANKEIYCKGNLKLVNLSLSYNKITVLGMLSIIEMLRHQQTVGQTQEGLSHVTLEGNLVTEDCIEMSDINDLIRKSYLRRFSTGSQESRRSSKRKRSGLSRVSIIA